MRSRDDGKIGTCTNILGVTLSTPKESKGLALTIIHTILVDHLESVSSKPRMYLSHMLVITTLVLANQHKLYRRPTAARRSIVGGRTVTTAKLSRAQGTTAVPILI